MREMRLDRRRLLAGGLVAGAGAAGLAGCSNSAQTQTPSGWTSVSFMTTGDSATQALFKEIIAAAQQSELDEKQIKLNWQPAPSSEWARIIQLFVNGTAADVQRIDDDRVYALAVDNRIHQLDKWLSDPEVGLSKDDYGDTFWTNNVVEGYKFSIEPYLTANVVYCNRDLLAGAGVQAPTSWQTPWDWDEFVGIVHQLTKRNGTVTEVFGVGFPSNVIQPQGYGAGDQALSEDETECGFASDAAFASIDALATLIREGHAPTIDMEQLPLFNSGKIAMMWGSMDSVPQLSEDINWDLAPWPKTPVQARTKNFSRSFVIPKSAKDPEAAYTALRALCRAESQALIAKHRIGVPALKSAATGPEFTDHDKPEHAEIWTQTMDSIDGVTVAVPFPRGPIAEKWQSVFTNGPLENGLMSGHLATRDYLDQAREQVNAEIKRRGWKKGAGLQALEQAGSLTDPDLKVAEK